MREITLNPGEIPDVAMRDLHFPMKSLPVVFRAYEYFLELRGEFPKNWVIICRQQMDSKQIKESVLRVDDDDDDALFVVLSSEKKTVKAGVNLEFQLGIGDRNRSSSRAVSYLSKYFSKTYGRGHYVRSNYGNADYELRISKQLICVSSAYPYFTKFSVEWWKHFANMDFSDQDGTTSITASFSNLPEDVTECILSYVDKVSRARVKCISREWRARVSSRLHLPIKTTLHGIVLQNRSTVESANRSVVFLELNNTGGATLCGSFDSPFGRNWLLLDSCKGLLLFGNLDNDELCLYEPASQVCVFPPTIRKFSSINLMELAHGLAFDGPKWIVVSLFISPPYDLVLKIFYSETKHTQVGVIRACHPDSLYAYYRKNFTVTLFIKGILCIVLNEWMYTYQVKDGNVSSIKLPHLSLATYSSRCMWQSEGRVYYGFRYKEGFQIWELLTVNQCDGSNSTLGWLLIENLSSELLMLEYPDIFNITMGVRRFHGGPCAFNDDFQILYFQLPGKIAAYDLKSRSFKIAFTFNDGGTSGDYLRVLPYYFNPQPLLANACNICENWTSYKGKKRFRSLSGKLYH